MERAQLLMRFFALPTHCGLRFSEKFSDGGKYGQHEISRLPERARKTISGDLAGDDEIPCQRPCLLRSVERKRKLLRREKDRGRPSYPPAKFGNSSETTDQTVCKASSL